MEGTESSFVWGAECVGGRRWMPKIFDVYDEGSIVNKL